jgi:hypothetical protein
VDAPVRAKRARALRAIDDHHQRRQLPRKLQDLKVPGVEGALPFIEHGIDGAERQRSRADFDRDRRSGGHGIGGPSRSSTSRAFSISRSSVTNRWRRCWAPGSRATPRPRPEQRRHPARLSIIRDHARAIPPPLFVEAVACSKVDATRVTSETSSISVALRSIVG